MIVYCRYNCFSLADYYYQYACIIDIAVVTNVMMFTHACNIAQSYKHI